MRNKFSLEKSFDLPIDDHLLHPLTRKIYDMLVPDIEGKSIHSVMTFGNGVYLKKLLPYDVKYFSGNICFENERDVLNRSLKDDGRMPLYDAVIADGSALSSHGIVSLFQYVVKICGCEFIISYIPLEWCKAETEENTVARNSKCLNYSEFIRTAQENGFLLVGVEKCITENNESEKLIFQFKRKTSYNLSRYQLCTGCSVCAKSCPANAIEMVFDSEGFTRPEIDNSLCIRCEKCVMVCPSLNLKESEREMPVIYAAWANDQVRMRTSSGGMFWILSHQILLENGYVCGAQYEPQTCEVRHVTVDRVDDLVSLCRSKYVQSNFGKCLDEIKELVKKTDKKILVAGCPCQIAALKSFLNEEYENLFLVDILCSGVPSPMKFKKYINEQWQNKIADINFRPKEKGWNSVWLAIKLLNGEIIYRTIENDSYEKFFHSFIGMRKACYMCLYANIPHESDITLGDFWGIQNYCEKWNDGKGTSFVAINTEKGARLLDKCKMYIKKIEQVDYQYTNTNRITARLTERYKMPRSRNYFYALEQGHSFNESVERALTNKHTIGLISNWSGYNYGAQLTQYALYWVLNSLGYDVLMIERPRQDYWGGNADYPFLFRNNPYKNYDLCPRYNDVLEMYEINDLADIFIVGSDQLWNSAFAEKELFSLSFIRNDKKKLSYATSFGCYPHNWKEDEISQEKYFLQQFDSISVREDTGVAILENIFEIKAEKVFDPVFLCDKEVYERQAEYHRINVKGKYVFAFILDPTKKKREILSSICTIHKCPPVCVTDVANSNIENDCGFHFKRDILIEDILYLIQQSEYVVTDSFHGMCLAVIFKKQFVVLNNKQRGETRFASLAKDLELQKKIIDSDVNVNFQSIIDNRIEYGRVMYLLELQKNKSRNWLKDKLEEKSDKRLNTFDILNAKNLFIEKSLKEKELICNQKRTVTDKVIGEVSQQSIDMCNDLGGQIEGINQQLAQVIKKTEKQIQHIRCANDDLNEKIVDLMRQFSEINMVISKVSQQSIDMCNDLGGQIASLSQRMTESDVVLSRVSRQSIDMCNDLGGQIAGLGQRLSECDAVLSTVSKQSVDMCNDLGGQIAGLNQRMSQSDMVLAEISRQSIDMCNNLGGQIEGVNRKLQEYYGEKGRTDEIIECLYEIRQSKIWKILRTLFSSRKKIENIIDKLKNNISIEK